MFFSSDSLECINEEIYDDNKKDHSEDKIDNLCEVPKLIADSMSSSSLHSQNQGRTKKKIDWVELKTKLEFSPEEWCRMWVDGKFIKYKCPSLFAAKLQHIENLGCIFASNGNSVQDNTIKMKGRCIQLGCRLYKFVMKKSALESTEKKYSLYSTKIYHEATLMSYLSNVEDLLEWMSKRS